MRLHRATALLLIVFVALFVELRSIVAQEVPRFRIREEAARDYFQRGLGFYNSQQYVAAREFFYQALDILPWFHLARRYLGDAYYYSGDWSAALEQWEFLDEISDGAYPLVRQRSDILRFTLQDDLSLDDYVVLRHYDWESWPDFSFRHPVDLYVDEWSDLFLLSYDSANILQIRPTGEVRRTIRGPIFRRLQGPLAFAFFDERIYVAEYGSGRITLFDRFGSRESVLEGSEESGRMRGPSGVAVSDDAIFVADSGNRRLLKFNRAGEFLFSFGQGGGTIDAGGSFTLEHPAAILWHESDQELLVADRDGGRILRFDSDGNYLDELTSTLLRHPRGISIYGDQLIVADEVGGVLFYHFPSHEWSRLEGVRDFDDLPLEILRPFKAMIDRNRLLHIADYASHRVTTLVPRQLRTTNFNLRLERVDESRFPDMALFVTVLNRAGEPLRGLDRANFLIYENDRRIHQIRSDNIEVFRNRMNLVIVKENSPAFEESFNDELPHTLSTLLDPLRISDRMKVIRVGEHVRLIYEGLERLHALRHLQSGDIGDSPNLGRGLYDGITELLVEMGARNLLLIVSGSEVPSAFDQYSMTRIIQYAQAHRIAIHVLSFESDSDPWRREEVRDAYQRVATQTNGRYYSAYDREALRDLYGDMHRNEEDRYILTFRSGIDRRLRGRYADLRIEVHHLGTSGVFDGGYFVP